jgi:uncharacterized tellurite resistance protein B-like protein
MTEHSDWTDYHDLALIFLSCMHDTDAGTEPTDADTIASVLHDRADELSANYVRRVVNDATLVYFSQTGADMVSAAVASLPGRFSKPELLDVLQDLATIVSADGLVYPDEVSFITRIAEAWGLDRPQAS